MKDIISSYLKSYHEYCPDSQKKYFHEMQDMPQQAYWERWMTAFCLSIKLDVQSKEQRKAEPRDGRPDIKIILEDSSILWIECVVPENAKKTDYHVEETKEFTPSCEDSLVSIQTNFSRNAKLRITNTLDNKLKQYKKRISNRIISIKDYYIVAINKINIGNVFQDIILSNSDFPDVADQVCNGKGETNFVYRNNRVVRNQEDESSIQKNNKFISTNFFDFNKKDCFTGVISASISAGDVLPVSPIKFFSNPYSMLLPDNIVKLFLL